MINIAYAMGQSGSAQGSGGFASFVPIILMFAVFYFLLIRPQQKKSKELATMIRNLKKGDRIIISGGIQGRITGLNESTLTVEIADKVRVKVARGSVTLIDQPSTPDKQISK